MPGANDDASGTVAVIELARAFAGDGPTKRGILFVAYGSEEIGGLGSTWFGEHPPVPLDTHRRQYRVRDDRRAGPQAAQGRADDDRLRASEPVRACCRRRARWSRADPYPDEHFFERSDNYSLALKGIVAHTLSGWAVVPTYHQPTDTVENLDIEYMTAAIKSLVAPIRLLADGGFTPAMETGRTTAIADRSLNLSATRIGSSYPWRRGARGIGVMRFFILFGLVAAVIGDLMFLDGEYTRAVRPLSGQLRRRDPQQQRLFMGHQLSFIATGIDSLARSVATSNRSGERHDGTGHGARTAFADHRRQARTIAAGRRCPAPGPGEIVVRIEAAPINPSDQPLLLGPADLSTLASDGTVTTAAIPEAMAGMVAARLGKSLPAGNEGAGVVVAAGDGAEHLIGKTVAVLGGGMYTQYRKVPAASALVYADGVTPAQGASAFVNPLTALGMVETMKLEGHTALVHTAAASNLGQMLNKVCIADGVRLVNIVRNDEQAKILTDIGAKYVVDSSKPDFRNDTDRGAVRNRRDDRVRRDRRRAARRAYPRRDGSGAGPQDAAGRRLWLAGAQAGLYLRPARLVAHDDRGQCGFAWGVGGFLLTPFLMKVGPEAVVRAAPARRRRNPDDLRQRLHLRNLADRGDPARDDPRLAAQGDRREIPDQPDAIDAAALLIGSAILASALDQICGMTLAAFRGPAMDKDAKKPADQRRRQGSAAR